MSDIVGLFRAKSAAEVVARNLPLPTLAELVDLSGVPFLQVNVSGLDELGFVRFENEKPLGGTLWKQTPFSIRLTPNGERPFLVDFPWPDEVAQAS